MTCILKASSPVNEIKDGNTIREVWDRLGLPNPPTSDKCVRSPFREDRNPSFSVFEQVENAGDLVGDHIPIKRERTRLGRQLRESFG